MSDWLRELRAAATEGEWQAVEWTVCKAHGGEEIAYLGDAETRNAAADALLLELAQAALLAGSALSAAWLTGWIYADRRLPPLAERRRPW